MSDSKKNSNNLTGSSAHDELARVQQQLKKLHNVDVNVDPISKPVHSEPVKKHKKRFSKSINQAQLSAHSLTDTTDTYDHNESDEPRNFYKKKQLTYEEFKKKQERLKNKPKKPMSMRRVRSTSFALLARREHSQKEMTEKLVSYGAKPEDVASVLEEFAEKKYQSDERMSEVVMRHEMNRGRGALRIKQSLYKHNLSSDAVNEQLKETNWLLEAVKARIKRFGTTLPTTDKDKAKQLRFLQYRGYSVDVCYKAIKIDSVDSVDEYE